MIKASFNIRPEAALFTLSGHSGYAEQGSDIVCAAVSSAVYMTANTITDILGIEADVTVKEDDGYLVFSFSGSKAAADIVKGLKLHLEGLSEQYPNRLKVTTEV